MSQVSERIAGIVIADATVRGFPMIYVSPGFEQLTGYTADEVLGRSCSLLQGPETDPRAVDVLRRAVAGGDEGYATLLNYRKDGSSFWNEISLAAQRDETGQVVRYLGVQKDVSDREDAQRRMHELAYTDALTGLQNRAAFTEQLARALDEAHQGGEGLALLFIDLDDFKTINDTYGHAAGDLLLTVIARRLRAELGLGLTLARTGGDEFLALVRDPRNLTETAQALAAALVTSLGRPVEFEHGRSVIVRASIGISTYPHDADTTEELLKHADAAMYAAKRAGKNRFQLYRPMLRKTGYQEDFGFDALAAAGELDRILVEQQIFPLFQPIVALETGAVVGYEALARGPEGSPLQRPDRLFAVADAVGRIEELDWLCRARAIETALEQKLGHDVALFLNCEPTAIDAPCPPQFAQVWRRAQTELELVLEITEREVTDRPAELSRTVQEHRAAGRGIALDDLGADIRSLALLPFVEPDVIKLDLRLVQGQPSAEQSTIIAAVAAERERTGADVVAEGVESEHHLAVARSFGATLGQGYLWGRPAPLPRTRRTGWRRPVASRSERTGRTPFEVVAADGSAITTTTTKSLLLPMSHHLETRALNIGEGAVLLSAFQDARHFTRHTAQRYAALAATASFVAALGVGLTDAPVPDVRGAAIDPDDPLAGEWSVLVVGPHFAGALVAQDLGDHGRESDRRFVFATTYRRELVIAAARTLLERVVPVSTDAKTPVAA